MSDKAAPLHYQKFIHNFETYTDGQSNWISKTANMNAITFWNKGTSVITINNVVPLSANDFISFSGDEGETDDTQYIWNTDNSGTNNLVVIKKSYV